MSKLKKTLIVVTTLVVLVASFVISSFALPSEEALEGSSLPKVSFSGIRSNGEFYTGTDVMFPAIDTHPETFGRYHAQISGDVTGSIRSRWTYIYDNDDFNYPFSLSMLTENLTYDIVIDFPLDSLGEDEYGDIGWDFQTCYMVNNSFLYTPTDQNEFSENNFLVTLVLVDSRGSFSPNPNFDDNGFCIIETSTPYVISLREFLDGYAIFDLNYVSISRMVISTFDNIYYTYGQLNLQSWSNYRYKEAFYLESRFKEKGNDYIKSVGFSEGYDVGYEDGEAEGYAEGKADGFESGKIVGYDRGYDVGYLTGKNYGASNAIEEMGVFSMFTKSIDALMDFPIFDLPNGGTISLGLLLGVIVGAMAFVWLLKLIAGG